MSAEPQSPSNRRENQASETTPLLAGAERSTEDHGEDEDNEAQLAGPTQGRRRYTYTALGLLLLATVLVMVLGFFIPESVQQYAIQASTLDLESVVPEFTETGAKAKVKGTYTIQSSRVKGGFTRRFGVFATWIAREVETGEAHVQVTLPEYQNIVIGTATLPPLKVKIRDHSSTKLDFVADLQPPKNVAGIRTVADDWVGGRLDHLTLLGTASVSLRSGLIRLPSQIILHSLHLQQKEIPQIPEFNITKLLFREIETPDHKKYMEADASITVRNDYPVDLDVPPLDFNILVNNCLPSDPRISLVDANLKNLHVFPKQDVQVNVTGLVRELPEALTQACPNSDKSPLDTFLGTFIHGQETIIYVTGSKSPSPDTPKWISGLMSSITVPVPFPGRTFDNLIRNFTLTDVKFTLPPPYADPNQPESLPKVSANIEAVIVLPQEMNFPIDVGKVRAISDVFYHKKKLGELNLEKWQDANSTRIKDDTGDQELLLVKSSIVDAPLDITDDDTFSEVIQALIIWRKDIELQIKADVDVKVSTTLGELTVRQIPAEGTVPVKPIGSTLDEFSPKIGDLSIVETTDTSLTLQAVVNITNPTEYSAIIPYADVNILVNNTVLGHATTQNISIVPGPNENLVIQAIWDPSAYGGDASLAVGRELLSQFISGYNTSLTIKTHGGTIPAQPRIGKALESIKMTVPTPRLNFPKKPDSGDDDDDDKGDNRPHFIKAVTMHIFSSSADFLLQSPLVRSIIYITSVNATAFYKKDEVGKISYDLPFAVHPGETMSPPLPVDWNMGSVGYEAVRRALGGRLKLHAEANVSVNIGKWKETVWYRGNGIGTRVSF